MIVIKHRGNFAGTEGFFKRAIRTNYRTILEKYAKEGVEALRKATPKDTGETADSWAYEIRATNRSYIISWTNSHIVDGVPIAIVLQYGHGTSNGGYVQGQDYINPALAPIFQNLADTAWREVTKS